MPKAFAGIALDKIFLSPRCFVEFGIVTNTNDKRGGGVVFERAFSSKAATPEPM